MVRRVRAAEDFNEGGTRTDEEPFFIPPSDDDGMDDGDDEAPPPSSGGPTLALPGPEAAKSGQLKQFHETPISRYPKAEYGFDDTKTIVSIAQFEFSFIPRASGQALDLSIRLNSINKPSLPTVTNPVFRTQSTTRPQIAAYSDQPVGFYQYPFGRYSFEGIRPQFFLTTGGVLDSIDTTFNDVWMTAPNKNQTVVLSDYDFNTPYTGNVVNIEPWKSMYDSYAVLGAEVELFIDNVGFIATSGSNGPDIITNYVQEGQSTHSNIKIMPTSLTLEQMEFMPIPKNFKVIHGRHDNTAPVTSVIRAHYDPHRVRKGVSNDEAIQTWTKTNADPAAQEFIHFQFWRHPQAICLQSDVRANCKLVIKKIIQFKDIKNNLYYLRGPSDIATNLPGSFFTNV
ncbi:hypothetical protein PINS_up006546 [Pythium insidiosum]|nr:hypothetical protein PINS_up006546 [Pythium insidiosum]